MFYISKHLRTDHTYYTHRTQSCFDSYGILFFSSWTIKVLWKLPNTYYRVGERESCVDTKAEQKSGCAMCGGTQLYWARVTSGLLSPRGLTSTSVHTKFQFSESALPSFFPGRAATVTSISATGENSTILPFGTDWRGRLWRLYTSENKVPRTKRNTLVQIL